MTDALAVRYAPTELDTESLGDIFVKSGYFKDTRDRAQAIVKILAGRELGFGPIASMQGVYLVNGRVTLSANLVGAAIKRSGRYDYRVDKLDQTECRMTFFEQGKAIGDSSFSLEDAKQAGLLASDTYKKFPRNMLFSRALTNGARWYCPDVFNGPIYTPDELGAQVDLETGEVIDMGVRETPAVLREVPKRERSLHELVQSYQRGVQKGLAEGWIAADDVDDWILNADAGREDVLIGLEKLVDARPSPSEQSEAPAELTTPPAF